MLLKTVFVLAFTACVCAQQKPLEFWSFSEPKSDIIGTTIGGDSDYKNGALVLGNCRLEIPLSSITKNNLESRTIETWIRLDNPNLRSQGYMGVQWNPLQRDQFDSIVYGEINPQEWISGSSNHRRTQNVGGGRETGFGDFDANDFVHIAITYNAVTRKVQVYRNGKRYGNAYEKGGIVSYPPESSFVYFGKRHGVCTGRAPGGALDCAALYDKVLSDSEVLQSFNMGCCGHSHMVKKNAVGCDFCEDGKFHDTYGSCKDVKTCEIGSYVKKPASEYFDRECEVCKKGYFTSSKNQENCEICPPGYFCPGGSNKKACPDGTFSNSQGAEKCTKCGESSHSHDSGTLCVGIKAGFYGVGGPADDMHTDQKPCEKGYACPGGSTDRTKCPAGFYTDEMQQIVCKRADVCVPGEYVLTSATSVNNVECKPCPKGMYSDKINAPQCSKLEDCPPGTYVKIDDDLQTQQKVCATCKSGEYSSVVNSVHCERWTECGDRQWSPPPTPQQDRDCRDWASCETDQKIKEPGTSTSDTVCTAAGAECGADQYASEFDSSQLYCRKVRTCKSNQFELSPPTKNTNRICDRIRECGDGETEIQAPTATTDRVCKSLCFTCPLGQYEVEACNTLTKSATVCEVCDSCGDDYVTSPCTSSTNRKCITKTIPINALPVSPSSAANVASDSNGNIIIEPSEKGAVHVRNNIYINGDIDVAGQLQDLSNRVKELTEALRVAQQQNDGLNAIVKSQDARIRLLERPGSSDE
eukprot:m.194792 g.194792  ORF g.194792 m.194792 type:complete len:754 (+) comp15681_c0_seq3:163-2424(+)